MKTSNLKLLKARVKAKEEKEKRYSIDCIEESPMPSIKIIDEITFDPLNVKELIFNAVVSEPRIIVTANDIALAHALLLAQQLKSFRAQFETPIILVRGSEG